MGTSRRLFGLVLLLLVVGGGVYLLYGEHQRQAAERAAADAAPPEPVPAPVASASEPPAATASPQPPASEPAAEPSAETPASTTTAPAEPPAPAATPSTTTSSETPPATAPEPITQPEPTVAPQPGVPTFDVVRVEPSGDAVMAGRSDPGMVIALFANGQEIGRTRANDSGEWVITLEQPLRPGEYVITVVGASDDGKRQVESVDRIAVSIPDAKSEAPMVALMSPDAPTKVLQQPDAPPPAATADAAATSPAATADAATTEPAPATPAAPAASAPVATAAAEAPDGTTATALSAGSAPTSSTTGGPIAVAPPPAWTQTLAAGADTGVGGAAAPAPGATAAAPAPPPAVVDANAAASAALVVGVVEKDDGRVNVSGASLPWATVRVYVDDALIGETTADAAGRWALSAPHEVDAGAHAVRIDQVEPSSGAVIARSEVPFDVLSTTEIAAAPATPDDTAVVLPPTDPLPAAPSATVAADAPAAGGTQTAAVAVAPAKAPAANVAAATPAEQKAGKATVANGQARTVRIRRGDDLWTLAERHYGKRQGERYTAIYRANRKQIRDPDLIYPGQVFVIPR